MKPSIRGLAVAFLGGAAVGLVVVVVALAALVGGVR